MKKILYLFELALLFCILPFVVSPVNAGTSISVGVVGTNYNVGFPDNLLFDDNAMGYDIAINVALPLPWLTVEFSATDNGTSSRTVGPLTYELDSESMAVMLHGQWVVGTIAGHNVKVHTRYGFSSTQFVGRETFTGLSNTDTDIGLSYGLGASYWITPHWGVELDYLQRQHQANITPFVTSTYHMQQFMLKGVYAF